MDVEVEGLRFARAGRTVLDVPWLHLRSGRRVAVLGANGAGKTTLLRLIAALEPPLAGQVRVGGRPARADAATRRAIAVLVTHDREEALRLGDDLIVLSEGRVLAAGVKEDVVSGLKDAAVARALGYAVLPLAGRLVAVPPGALRLGGGPGQFTIAVEEVVDLVERREVIGRREGVRVRVSLAAFV